MTKEEKKLALYCLKASSDYHSEVCEECINYPNCDHTIQDDVTETIIKALEQTDGDLISREVVIEWLKGKDIIKLSSQEESARKELKELFSGKLQPLPKQPYKAESEEEE